MLLVTAAVTYGFIALYTPGRYLIAVEEKKYLPREAEDPVGEIEKSNKRTTHRNCSEQLGGQVFCNSDPQKCRCAKTVDGQEAKGNVKEPEAMYEFRYKDSPDTYTLSIGGKQSHHRPAYSCAESGTASSDSGCFNTCTYHIGLLFQIHYKAGDRISEASKKMASLDF